MTSQDELTELKAENERLKNGIETALVAMRNCEHDGGFDREIGPIGCYLGDRCVCMGLFPNLAEALKGGAS